MRLLQPTLSIVCLAFTMLLLGVSSATVSEQYYRPIASHGITIAGSEAIAIHTVITTLESDKTDKITADGIAHYRVAVIREGRNILVSVYPGFTPDQARAVCRRLPGCPRGSFVLDDTGRRILDTRLEE